MAKRGFDELHGAILREVELPPLPIGQARVSFKRRERIYAFPTRNLGENAGNPPLVNLNNSPL